MSVPSRCEALRALLERLLGPLEVAYPGQDYLLVDNNASRDGYVSQTVLI